MSGLPHESNELLRSEGDVNTSPLRREWDASRGETARRLLRRDADVFLHQSLSTPCLDVLAGAGGSRLFSGDGDEYIDFHGNSVHQLGYACQSVVEAVIAQLQTLPFCPRRYTNEAAVRCAEKLVALAPAPLGKVLFAPGGAIVNSMALKLARLVGKRHKVISLYGSFHGATLDTIAAGGEQLFRAGMEPLMPGVIHVPPPWCRHGRFGAHRDEMEYADYIDYVAEQQGDIGALIAEPLRCTDVRIPSRAYWQRIREICTRRNIVLILDEIPTALGRCGTMFAFERFGIVPDIVTLGKGLGGGVVPFAALLARKDYDCGGQVALGHFTHEKSPIGAAAAAAVVDYIHDTDLLSRVMQCEQRMARRLEDLQRKHRGVRAVRGMGMLWGVELTDIGGMSAPLYAERVLYEALRRGLSFKVSQGRVLTLAPPLTIDDETLEQAFAILDETLERVS